ncbi:MAG: hypothetical protein K2K68_09775, partial [Duncaniella sp.]|nr:hypothetical protein [Duncaniella sp.]
MRKFSTMLMLLCALFTGVSAWAQEGEFTHVTTERYWDFTKGKNHANEVTNCEYWSSGSKGRYALAKALDNQELPSNNGGALTGLDGVYFTVGSGAVYGITQNFCFQNGNMTVRIPGCGVNDEIIIDFAGSGGAATVTSDNITSELKTELTAQKDETKQSTKVKENGDVILKTNCGKGFRLYSIKVIPFIPKERHFTD